MATHNLGYGARPMGMDHVRAAIKALEQAKLDVAPYIGGAPAIACDSAAEVYAAALTHMGIAHDGVSASQLGPMFHAVRTMRRQPASLGAPTAAAKKRHAEAFPNAGRLGRSFR